MIYFVIAVLLVIACIILLHKPNTKTNKVLTINLNHVECGGCSKRLPIIDEIICEYKGETIWWSTSKTTRADLRSSDVFVVREDRLPKVIITKHGTYPDVPYYKYVGSIGGKGRPKCDAVCTDVYVYDPI